MAIRFSVRFRKAVTVLVWLAGLALATSMLVARPAGDAQGMAWSEPVVVSAPETGELVALTTGLHEAVREGQLIAKLDPAPLLARSEVLAAELRALNVEETSDARGRTRRFESDRETARLELARLRGSVAEEEARLVVIEAELAREQGLAESGVRAASVADDLRRRADVIRARLEAERARLLETEKADRDASARALAASGPNRWRIIAAQRRLDEVTTRLARLELHSPIDGQVTQLTTAPGAFFETGQPILRISPTATREVHVWTKSHIARRARIGDPATVRRASGERLPGVVVSVGVERLPLPEALWYRSNVREWGYLVRVQLVAETLAPGEPVRVSLHG